MPNPIWEASLEQVACKNATAVAFNSLIQNPNIFQTS